MSRLQTTRSTVNIQYLRLELQQKLKCWSLLHTLEIVKKIFHMLTMKKN